MNLISWGSSLMLGMLHALEPGHGKTYLAAIMMGKSWDKKQLMILISSLIGSHFLVLIALAIGIRNLMGGIQDEAKVEMLSGFMPIFIIAYGGYLAWNYHKSHKKGCTSGGCSCQAHKQASNNKRTGNSMIEGVIAGLIPCPTALAPLLLAGLDQHFTHVLGYLLVYLLGMSIVMIGLVLGVQLIRPFIIDKLNNYTFKIHPQLFSAFLLMAIGICYLMFHITHHIHI